MSGTRQYALGNQHQANATHGWLLTCNRVLCYWKTAPVSSPMPSCSDSLYTCFLTNVCCRQFVCLNVVPPSPGVQPLLASSMFQPLRREQTTLAAHQAVR